ncbi:MAG: hypothetical protein NUK65_10145 [Firmicutes bacterium]|nr:hypothetical protein [Bacillota bacterium]
MAYDIINDTVKQVRIGDANFLRISRGLNDLFAAVHFKDGNQIKVTAHSIVEPSDILATISIATEEHVMF